MYRVMCLIAMPAVLTVIINGQLGAQFSEDRTEIVTASLDEPRSGAVEILDAYLRARIKGLEKHSPRFYAAMERARLGNIPVIIGSPVQVHERVAARAGLSERLDGQRVGEFVVRRTEAGRAEIEFIAIRIDVARVRRGAGWRALLGAAAQRRWFDANIDAILIHEIWGHLVPVIEAGDLTGNCPDPRAGESAGSSCVMQRENDLRTELGLKPRRSYAISVD
jgi:hypothetical protein